jgi:hypothetical protein
MLCQRIQQNNPKWIVSRLVTAETWNVSVVSLTAILFLATEHGILGEKD